MECKYKYYLVRKIGLIVLLKAINFFVFGQVENNNIDKRIDLSFNNSVHSTTAKSTVEWSCISKSLTSKCLVYHNDQWFSFTPQHTGTYFLNISSQQCQKNHGVQLIIIEGDPCLVSSYRVLNCIPKITQSDVFIELNELQAHKVYLINVDGFLGDFCEFDIQLSDSPVGIPWQQQSLDTLSLNSETVNNIVKLTWHAAQQQLDQLAYFEINRLKFGEQKFEKITNIAIRSNALGKHEEDYQFIDTLLSYGTYQYDIIGVYKETGYRVLLDRTTVSIQPETNLPKQFIARVPLSFSGKGKIEGRVVNASTDEILTIIQYDYVYPETLGVNLTKYVKLGVSRFWVKIRNTKTKEFNQFTFQVTNTGELHLINK